MYDGILKKLPHSCHFPPSLLLSSLLTYVARGTWGHKREQEESAAAVVAVYHIPDATDTAGGTRHTAHDLQIGP